MGSKVPALHQEKCITAASEPKPFRHKAKLNMINVTETIIILNNFLHNVSFFQSSLLFVAGYYDNA